MKEQLNKLAYMLCAVILISGCAPKTVIPPPTKGETYRDLYRESPHTILVLMPINKTNNVEAKEFFYTTITTALSDQGYYVLSPFVSQEILRRESANDSEVFLDAALTKFGEVFGADAVLFTVIHKWKKNVVTDNVETEVEYILKSTKTNTVLFERRGDLIYDTTIKPSRGSGLVGLAVAVAASKIKTATTSHVKVSRMCNRAVLGDIPAGKYQVSHMLDSSYVSGLKEFTLTLGNN